MIKHECQNCGSGWDEDELYPLKHIHERVAPGEPMPSGECPECGAVCHPEEVLFNHAFSIGFEAISGSENPEGVTEEELLKGLMKRISSLLHEGGLRCAVDCFDTMEANA